MSVASEITRLQNAKASLKTSINAKTDQQHQITTETIDDYSDFVDSISASVDTTDIRTVINMTDANLTSSTPFTDYPQGLYDGYINVLKDRDVLLDNMTKGTSTGNITEGLGLPIYEDKMSKLSTQNGTPTPTNPVEINTVKGISNLFNKNTATNGYRLGGDGTPYADSNYVLSDYISIKPSSVYTYSRGNVSGGGSSCICFYDSTQTFISRTLPIIDHELLSGTIETPNNAYYARMTDKKTLKDSMMLIEGNIELPYLDYGNNYIYVTITDGVNSKNVIIPLNNNEICGIGDYLDELIVDKTGHCYLNKKISKLVLKGTEDWQYYNGVQYITSITNYKLSGLICLCSHYETQTNVSGVSQVIDKHCTFRDDNSSKALYIKDTSYSDSNSFKTWLSTHNVTVYYILATENLIDLNYTVDLTLYEGNNTITNNATMDMQIKYIKDTYE